MTKRPASGIYYCLIAALLFAACGKAPAPGTVKDEALTDCPACGGSLRKVFGSIGIAFKGRHRQLHCTLLACWEAGYKDPWLILTDLPPEAASPPGGELLPIPHAEPAAPSNLSPLPSGRD